MTVGIDYLLAIVKTKSKARLLSVPQDFLANEEEQKLYDYLCKYHSEHKRFPFLASMRKRFPSLPDKLPRDTVEHYQEEVHRRTAYRLLQQPIEKIRAQFKGAQTDMDSIDRALSDLWTIRNRLLVSNKSLDDSRDVLNFTKQRFETALRDHQMHGIPTGWGPVDDAVRGYQNGDLIIWVGRIGRGKTMLMLKQAYSAWSFGNKVLWMSMEVNNEQSMRRMVGIHANVNPNLIRDGEIRTSQIPRIMRAFDEMNAFVPMKMVSANFKRSVNQLSSYIEEHDPDIVFVDAAYLLSPEKKRYGSSGRRETISDVVEELKALASDCNRPIVCSVQFNRQAEHRRRSVRAGLESFNPIGHLSLVEIGETDVIGQAASHVFGIELGMYPHARDTRAFGILKGREGEGEGNYWFINYPASRIAPLDLSILGEDDPRVQAMKNAYSRRATPEDRGQRRVRLDYMRGSGNAS